MGGFPIFQGTAPATSATVTQPAAGADWTYSVVGTPGELLSVYATFTTASGGGNRTPKLNIKAGGTTLVALTA